MIYCNVITETSLVKNLHWFVKHHRGMSCISRDYPVHAPDQWEMTLQCNVVSHWLGAYTKRSLHLTPWFLSFPKLDKFDQPQYWHHRVNSSLSFYEAEFQQPQSYQQSGTKPKLAGIILCLHPANERQHYKVTPSLICWAHSQNDLQGSFCVSAQLMKDNITL